MPSSGAAAAHGARDLVGEVPPADGLVRAARARPTASITSIQASCGFACSRIVPKKPRLSFALGSVEDPFSIVALRYPGDRMHALLGPEVKPNSEEFQSSNRSIPRCSATL